MVCGVTRVVDDGMVCMWKVYVICETGPCGSVEGGANPRVWCFESLGTSQPTQRPRRLQRSVLFDVT